jgi:hypothetical protein
MVSASYKNLARASVSLTGAPASPHAELLCVAGLLPKRQPNLSFAEL